MKTLRFAFMRRRDPRRGWHCDGASHSLDRLLAFHRLRERRMRSGCYD
jgi:hypothetical protein